MYMHKPESVLENEMHKIPWNFWERNKSYNPGQKNIPGDNKKKKKKKKKKRKKEKREKKRKPAE